MASSTVKDRAVSDNHLLWNLQSENPSKSDAKLAHDRIKELLDLAITDQELMLEQAAEISKLKKDLHNMRVSRDKYKQYNAEKKG